MMGRRPQSGVFAGGPHVSNWPHLAGTIDSGQNAALCEPACRRACWRRRREAGSPAPGL